MLSLASVESLAQAAPLPRDVASAPAPRWETAPASMPNADAAASETGLADVLIDDQLHVTSTLEHYMHRVRKVTSAAGIEDGAEIEITFDPAHRAHRE